MTSNNYDFDRMLAKYLSRLGVPQGLQSSSEQATLAKSKAETALKEVRDLIQLRVNDNGTIRRKFGHIDRSLDSLKRQIDYESRKADGDRNVLIFCAIVAISQTAIWALDLIKAIWGWVS